ncbi:fibronectin type III domain-containing protein [Saccharothrix sp.]|uniref:fibronectin type III domain-containing protein n=1 Tax=Saccharothrix sp. TaxID=1873460 RepID=UPI002811BAFE|nr:fibronectin type III domain-containing protein [Saccharothrix sp.]
MDRRRIAVIAAGVVLFGGVVAVLRTNGAGEPVTATSTSQPPPTSLAPFAAPGVLVPTPGAAPESPRGPRVVPGPRRLQVLWTGDAPGYEVRWGRGGAPDQTRLVAQPATELTGLDDGAEYTVDIRAVDAFGQRSDPLRVTGTPKAVQAGDYALADAFDQGGVPDPARWRLATRGTCAARAGDGNGRLVISSTCAAAPTSLRSRAPFVLRDADDLGRFVVETDAPGADGELFLDLVPGPVSTLMGDGLPPDTIRLRVASGNGKTTAEVVTAEGTPSTAVREVPALQHALTHRWELALRRDGTRVLLDGEVVATSPAVPRWREATALVSVAGPTGQRVHVGLVAFDGAPTSAPPSLPGPPVQVAVEPDSPPLTGSPIIGVAGGQLRMTLLHTDASPTAPEFTLAIGDARVPLRPAVPGAPWRAGVGYPLVADVPASALVVDDGRVKANVLTPLRVQATHVDLDLAPAPGMPTTAPSGGSSALPEVELELARIDGTILDASGKPVPEGATVHRGRLVFDLTLAGRPGQRGTGLAGLAGFTVRLDDDRVAAVPTNLGGPGVVGTYRLALDASGLSPGPHMIEVRVFGTSAGTRPTSAFVPFLVTA